MKLLLDRMGVKASDLIIKPNSNETIDTEGTITENNKEISWR